MNRYMILYKNGKVLLATENRIHYTPVDPSAKLVVVALHTICLNHKIYDFSEAKAVVFKNDKEFATYDLSPETVKLAFKN